MLVLVFGYDLDTWKKISLMVQLVVFITLEISSWKTALYASFPLRFLLVSAYIYLSNIFFILSDSISS